MEEFTDDLMLMLVKRILDDKPLSEMDVSKFQNYIYSIAVYNGEDEKEVKIKIKKFDQAIPNFLKKVSEVLVEAEKTHSRMYRVYTDEQERRRSLPKFAERDDHPDMVKFINLLKDDHYSFSAAEKLVGTSRQTLKSYAEAETHGLKMYQFGRNNRLLKQQLVEYYRLTYFRNFNYLMYVVEGESYAEQFINPIMNKK